MIRGEFSRIYKRFGHRFSIRSLDAPLPDGVGVVLDILIPVRPEIDRTEARVLKALKYWVKSGVLTNAEAGCLHGSLVQNMSYTQMAEATGVSRWTVADTYGRALEKLRNRYCGQALYRCACGATHAAESSLSECPVCARTGSVKDPEATQWILRAESSKAGNAS